MKTLDIEYWEVLEPDGGGMRSVCVAAAVSESVADGIAQYRTATSGWGACRVNKKTISIRLFERTEEFIDSYTQRKIAERARKKLTAEEIEALGL